MVSLETSNAPGWKFKFVVTPYIHIMIMHIPDLMISLEGIKKFTGQGQILFFFSTSFTIV